MQGLAAFENGSQLLDDEGERREVGRRVEEQLAHALDLRRRHRQRPPDVVARHQELVHDPAQHARVDRLLEEAVGSHSQRLLAVEAVPRTGEHDDRQPRQIGIGAQRPEEIPAAPVREREADDRDVGAHRSQRGQRFFHARRPDDLVVARGE